jgi:hypothetical protein
MKFTSLFSKKVYGPEPEKIASEYDDKKSSGADKYLLFAVIVPVTFFRIDGNCIEL